MAQSKINRREFLSRTAALSATLPVVAIAASEALAAEAPKEIEEKDLLKLDNPMAKGLKYVHDASKAPERKVAKMGVEASKQTCANCQLYKPTGTLKATKELVGMCQMIPVGHVKAAGWCNAWVKKA